MEAKRSEKINKNKRYNTYLVHQNYHQIWKNNKMPTERERERERDLWVIKCRWRKKKNKRNQTSIYNC